MSERREFTNKLIDSYQTLVSEVGELATVWGAFLKLVGTEHDRAVMAMKADLPIVERIATGTSVRAAARQFSIDSHVVYEVAKLWGLTPLEETLDFNPLLVYTRGMTPDQMEEHMVDILPIRLKKIDYEHIINNIERYKDMADFIEERDK